jgi:hypothetical protein
MAIQNLRDKLLKAGLVDKKQKQQVDTQDRREKKQKSVELIAQEEAEKERQFAIQQAAEAEANRQREAQRTIERLQHETWNRVRNICDRWAVRQIKQGTRRFHFVQRSGRIGYILVNDALYDQLLQGALAVVERLPPDEIAPPLREVDRSQVRARPRRPNLLAELLRAHKQTGLLQSVETHVLLAPEAAERVQEIDSSAVRFWARSNQPVGYVADLAS